MAPWQKKIRNSYDFSNLLMGNKSWKASNMKADSSLYIAFYVTIFCSTLCKIISNHMVKEFPQGRNRHLYPSQSIIEPVAATKLCSLGRVNPTPPKRRFGILSTSHIPHPDYRSVDNSIYYSDTPHPCQGHPLASDREGSCAGNRNPDKLSWVHEDFSFFSPRHSHKSYLMVKGNLTANWKAVINSSST